MSELPTGTVTFLFTDIEGSTKLLQALGDRYGATLERHHALLRESFERHQGVVVMTEGDAFFVVFGDPLAAVRAAATAQQSLAGEPWSDDAEVRVRMGLHTGQAILGGDNYVGIDVHRAARISAAAHGGQVLLSDATRALTQPALPDGLELRDLGDHRLKDMPRAERIFQLNIAGLTADFPAIRSLDSRPNNLPAPITSFIGREAQIAEISALLEGSRLLTLTGPGGTGKTRLSIRVAEEVLTHFEHGAWFVALDALRDPELLSSAIADALGLTVPGGQSPMQALIDHLAERELLLVLDNFEQLAPAARDVGEMISKAPRIRVLATSRVPLHLYGEHEYPVPPLGRVAELRRAGASAEAVSQYEAVQLFIERAVAVKSDFRVTNSNAPAVAELCARLDGLPLAIELAAARVKLLTPEQILARLGANLSLLASTAQDLPERQRTLQGAIDWSYDLLGAAEQRLFARLSVFSNGFSIESAEVVCADGLGTDVLDGLSVLLDNSLVRTLEIDGQTRFDMLETIRQYAADRLAGTTDEAATKRRHARHFLELARLAEPHIISPDQLSWLAQLEREHDNLRVAFERAPAVGLLDDALIAAGSVWRFWHQRGRFAEGRAVFDRLLAVPGASPAARAKALIGAGGIAYWQNDFEATERFYSEAGQRYEEAGDAAGIAEAAYNQGYLPMLVGDTVSARALAERAAEHYRLAGDELGLANAEILVAYTYYFEGRISESLPLATSGVERYRKVGAQWQLADSVGGLGYMHAVAGDWATAMPLLRESLNLLREAHNEVGLAMIIEVTASTAAYLGDHELAATLFGLSEATKQRLGGGVPAQLAQTDAQRKLNVEALGEERFAELHRRGAQLSLEEGIALAEAYEPPPDAPPAPAPTVTASPDG
jgi:predicted ATPase/class 3 adenylate cyclase